MHEAAGVPACLIRVGGGELFLGADRAYIPYELEALDQLLEGGCCEVAGVFSDVHAVAFVLVRVVVEALDSPVDVAPALALGDGEGEVHGVCLAEADEEGEVVAACEPAVGGVLADVPAEPVCCGHVAHLREDCCALLCEELSEPLLKRIETLSCHNIIWSLI